MRVLILGGDGYLGWPTAMQLSSIGHDVTVVDNYLRRRICQEMDVRPLFEVPSLDERAKIWKESSGKDISVCIGDLMDWSFVAEVFAQSRPEAVIHYAEQPSAPYSMANRRAATLTLKNNIEATANTIFAVRKFAPQAHIIKIGTMGENGTPNSDIQ